MTAGFGLTPAAKDAGRATLWDSLKVASKVVRVSRNIDKRPDPDGEAFIITKDHMLVFHTGKANIAGWLIRKKKEFGLYDYSFYRVGGDWLYKFEPTDDLQMEHVVEGTTMCSWIGYSSQIYQQVATQFASMPRYCGETYSSREEFEQQARERMVILGEYISEINKGMFYNNNDYHGAKHLPALERNAEMMRCFVNGKLPVLGDIQQLTAVPIEDIVRVEKFYKGEVHEHLSYTNADSTERKFANALFESVSDLKADFPSLQYRRRYFDDPQYAANLKPIKDMINYFARYEGHFKRDRCIQFIHGRDPYSFTQLAANMQKFYLIYRKKRLAYAAYICSEKVKPSLEEAVCM